MKKLLAILAILMVPAIALAQTATSSVVGVGSILSADDGLRVLEMLANAFRSGDWALGSGLLLTLVVAVARMLGLSKRLNKAWVPWATAGMAIAASVGVGLQTDQDWWKIVSTGLLVGLTAIGGWETGGKLVKKVMPKKAA